MAITKEFAAYLEDLFSVLPGSHARRMFGGVGVFRHGLMYALALEDGKICLKADAEPMPISRRKAASHGSMSATVKRWTWVTGKCRSA